MFWREKVGEKKRKKRTGGVPGSPVWNYMNKELGIDGQDLMYLKRAETDGVVGDKPATMVRIFDPTIAKEKGVAVEDYESLDNHLDLILYEGYYCETRGRIRSKVTDVHIEKR